MKMLPPEAVEQLQGRRPIISGAMRAKFGDGSPENTHCLWGGVGTIEIDGDTFIGANDRALITRTESRIGGAADSLTITLSQLDPDIAQTVENEDYHGKPVTIWRLIFGPDRKTLLGAGVFRRGRVDTVSQRERVGGVAALDFNIEGPRSDMNRRGARIRSDTDQRVLGGALDATFKYVSTVGRKTMRWGQKPSQIAGSSPFGGSLPIPRGIFGLIS